MTKSAVVPDVLANGHSQPNPTFFENNNYRQPSRGFSSINSVQFPSTWKGNRLEKKSWKQNVCHEKLQNLSLMP